MEREIIKNKCFFCDGDVVFTDSDMAQEVYPDCDEEDILHYAKCNICGSEYEIIQHQDYYNTSMKDELELRKEKLK